MTIRSRVFGAFATMMLLAGSAVLVSAGPVNASTVEVVVTTSADGAGTCPSESNCTLRQALADFSLGGIHDGSDGVITIAEGLGTIFPATTFEFDGGTTNAASLTINGNGITITGNDTFGLFALEADGTVSLNGITFTRGYSGTGGAIASLSPLSVSDSTFATNESSNLGGAIFALNDASFNNVIFASNYASNSGGAAYIEGDTTFENVQFVTNEAPQFGGALSLDGGLLLLNSVFTGNTSEKYGGAVFDVSAEPLHIVNTTFDANATTGSPGLGGAVAAINPVTISGSAFTNNSGSDGGAVYVDQDINVSSSRFSSNSADFGGAISAGGETTITTTLFENNIAPGGGGGFKTTGELRLSNSTMTNNQSVDGPGAFIATDSAIVTNSTITGNRGGSPSTVIAEQILIAYSTFGNIQSTESQPAFEVLLNLFMFGSMFSQSADATGPICSGPATSLGYNIATDDSCALTATGDLQNATATETGLGALGDHGGQTPTRVPFVTSAMRNAIPNEACQSIPDLELVADQRGFARPTTTDGPCDIGAVQLTPQVNALTSGRSVGVTITEFASTAVITIYSTPIELGTISVDQAGTGTTTFDVPCSVEAGTHTVTAVASGGQHASTEIMLEACVVPIFAG